MSLSPSMRSQLDSVVTSHRVVLFMKGTKRSPACGFSASVVEILDELIPGYETVDVLASPEIREGIKEYSEWPTLPQLYVEGRFVGGADIVREMHASGELAKALGVSAAEIPTPTITITEAALAAFREALGDDAEQLHFEIDARFAYSLYFGPRETTDVEVKASGLPILMSRATMRRADGVTIDFLTGPDGGGFKIESPHEPPRVRQISATELAAMIQRGDRFELFDVRTNAERAIATIPGARQLDAEAQRVIEGLDRGAMLVFHCHHGMRSQSAAEHFLGLGFKKVCNVRGGIDAWSIEVDPNVPRY
jgi:monothiol glutaredoxin